MRRPVAVARRSRAQDLATTPLLPPFPVPRAWLQRCWTRVTPQEREGSGVDRQLSAAESGSGCARRGFAARIGLRAVLRRFRSVSLRVIAKKKEERRLGGARGGVPACLHKVSAASRAVTGRVVWH